MKRIYLFLSTGLISILAGCASTPVVVGCVGPNPTGGKNPTAEGALEVISCLTARTDDENQGSTDPIWYQHTDYYVYNLQHKLLRHVDNTVGHYEEAPRTITLPPGNYLVKAHANDYFWVEVPVMIESGQTTRVHLDNQWQVPANVPKTELVSLPKGQPVGWSAEATRVGGMN